MVKPSYLLLLLLTTATLAAQKPVAEIDAVQFFKDESIKEVTIAVNLRRLLADKMKDGITFPASLTLKLDDTTSIQEPVSLVIRGNYRKQYCYIPPLKVNFKSSAASVLSSLGSLKLVNECHLNKNNNEYVLKEYLVYKIYNLITDKSLRARLLNIKFIDSSGKKKPVTEFGFFLEDVKDMADRNDCQERKRNINHTEQTNRQQMTRVAMFEYMIGNLDWSVPVRHNIKLIVPKADTSVLAFTVPYDFDHSGLVKTDYALPPPEMDLEDVTVRNYRGFIRSMDELQEVADEFLKQKPAIYKLINEFYLLPAATRLQMISYLDGFFYTITKPSLMKIQFIENARKN